MKQDCPHCKASREYTNIPFLSNKRSKAEVRDHRASKRTLGETTEIH